MTCYCDGTAHPWRRDYCGKFPAHDPDTTIERARAARRRAAREAAATPEETP